MNTVNVHVVNRLYVRSRQMMNVKITSTYVALVDTLRTQLNTMHYELEAARADRQAAREERALLLQMAACRMRRWRRKRRCPRAVRERWNPFPGKKPRQRAVQDQYRVRLADERAA